MEKVTADKVLKALAAKHWDDYFMTEVKNGPSYGAGMFRMDAVAIKKSWANPCITCYEVKVSRQDFLRDEKWPVYMSYCNRFAFACPEGLIQKEELSPEIGLYWYRGEGKPFKIVRHPVYRTVEIPVEFYKYIIMSKIQSDRHPFFNDREEYFKEYIENKKTAAELGYKLGYKLASDIRDLKHKIQRFESDKEDFEEAIALENRVIKLLNDHGITWNRWGESKTWYEALERFFNSGTRYNDLQLRKAIEHTEGALGFLNMMKGASI